MAKANPKASSKATTQWLSKAIGKAAQSKYYVEGCLPALGLNLVVEHVGPVKFPLPHRKAKALVAACRVAPYGQGATTLVDTNVRNTFELDPSQFRVGPAWTTAINGLMPTIAEGLGLPANQLEPHLYKLLVYERDGFFLPHRDSEKHERMVASLVVVLPSSFYGGELVIRHGPHRKRLHFGDAAQGTAASYAAFYADCEHEVERVTSGVRVVLAYNLVLKSMATAVTTTPKGPTQQVDLVTESLNGWVAQQPGEPLVFALEHQYTEHGLALDLLKGADRQLADLLLPSAAHAGCLAYLAQVKRHVIQYADAGEFDHGRSRRTARGAITLGEVYEDTFVGSEWFALDGIKQAWQTLPLATSAIISQEPPELWKPTSEDYEGYTGNAGNTMDRWYHRSALVIWHRDHHYHVLATAGPKVSFPLFLSMTKKLHKTPKKNLAAAHTDCVRLVRAIITEWPQRSRRIGYLEDAVGAYATSFLEQLLALKDHESVTLFLRQVAVRDESLPLEAFIVAACREFGWGTFADALKNFFVTPPDARWPKELLVRDFQWLAAYCAEPAVDEDHAHVAAEVCAVVVQHFCMPPSDHQRYSRYHGQPANTLELVLPWLLKALLASGHETGLNTVLRFVQQEPNTFRHDHGVVPTLNELFPWLKKQSIEVPAVLRAWLSDVRQQLQQATAQKPTSPKDWTRPSTLTCKCGECQQLASFLADATQEKGRIAAREDRRQHLIQIINSCGCDVTHTLLRSGSPYALLLTKTTGSYERALQRYRDDQQLLKSLPKLA